MMVGCGLMSVGSTVGVDVDDSGQGNLEGVVEFMLDPMSCLVSSGHRQFGINRDGGGHMKLMALPADLQLGDITDSLYTGDHGVGLVDDCGSNTVEETSSHDAGRSNE